MNYALKLSHARLLLSLLTPALLFSSYSTFAGTRDAGGGTGIVAGTKVILLDLVEAGADREPYLPTLMPDPAIVKALQKNLRAPDDFKNEILLPLATKLTDINLVAPSVGLYMATGLGAYQITPTSYQLTGLDDVDSAIGERKLQLAERKESKIYVNQENWQRLDMANKVALLIHEIVYAFQPMAADDDGSAINGILLTSAKARVLTGFFFLQDWHKNWQTRLAPDLSDSDNNDVFNYLYGAMVANSDSKSHADKMINSAHYSFLNDEIWPHFNTLEANIGNGRSRILRATNSPNDLARICQAAIVSDGSGEAQHRNYEMLANSLKTGGSSAIMSYDRMSFKLGKVVLKNSGNQVGVVTIAEKVGECANELAQIQKQWLR